MTHLLLLAALGSALAMLALLGVNLIAIPRLSQPSWEPLSKTTLPRVSVVIPARNEERDVAAAVRSHMTQDYPNLEVVVVDDRSTDRTAEILALLARESPRVRVVAGGEPPAGWLGKPHALHQGAQAAGGELLLFADADVCYDPRTVGEAVVFLVAHRADLVALVPRMEAKGFWENVLLPNLLFLFYCGPAFLANSDSARWLAVGGGAGNLIAREAYDAIGGHDALKDSVIDDVHLALRVKRAGRRTRVVRAEDRVSVRMYRGFREVCAGFSKNTAYLFSGGVGVVLLVFLLATLLLAVYPPAVLAAGALGGDVARADLRLALAAALLLVATRALLAAAIGDPIWTCWTHPILAAVWTGIIGRSFYDRIIRRRLTWRGREFDARGARF